MWMALLAFRGMGNVKVRVELLLKWEMVVMSTKCCSGFAVCVWLLEVLGMHGEIAHALGEGSVCSVWQLSIKTQLTDPTLCHFDGQLLLNGPLSKPKPSVPSLERWRIASCFFPAALKVQQCLPHVSCQDLFLAPWCPSQALKGSQSRSWREKKQQQTQDMKGWFRWKQRMAKVRVALDSRHSHTDHSSQPSPVVCSYMGFEEAHFQFKVCTFEQLWSSSS